MNSAIALFLPLIGGFLFATRVDFIKYEIAREHGHRFYFRVGYCGFILFLTSFCIVYVLAWAYESLPHKDAPHKWVMNAIGPLLDDPQQADVKFRLWVTCVLSVFLGRFSPKIINWCRKEHKVQMLYDAVRQDALESLLLGAINDEKTIAITTPLRKVYVGWPIETAEPNMERKYVAMLPLMSGYRDECGEVHFTTSYDWAYTGKNSPDAGRFLVVFPVNQITSASFFEPTIYAEFAEQNRSSDPRPREAHTPSDASLQ